MELKEILNNYKENMCPFCIHSNDVNYGECKIVIRVDGEANCVNYKCNEYCRKKNKEC